MEVIEYKDIKENLHPIAQNMLDLKVESGYKFCVGQPQLADKLIDCGFGNTIGEAFDKMKSSYGEFPLLILKLSARSKSIGLEGLHYAG